MLANNKSAYAEQQYRKQKQTHGLSIKMAQKLAQQPRAGGGGGGG